MNGKSGKLHSFTVRTVLILSCIIVALAPLVTAVTIYQFSASSIDRQTKDTNSAYLQLAVNTLDEFLAGVDSMATTLMVDKTFNAICLYESTLSTAQRYALTNFVLHELWDTTDNQGVLAKAIYLRNSDIFLFPGTYQTSERARWNGFADILWTDEDYDRIRSVRDGRQYFSIKSVKGEGLAFIQPIFKLNSQYGANLVYILSKQKIVDSLRGANWNSEGTLAVIDEGDRILLSTEEIELSPQELATLQIGEQEIHMNGENTLCLVKKSQCSSLRCLYIAPFRVIYSRLHGIRTMFLISAALCLAATVLLIVLVVRRNYSPVNRIMEQIPASGEGGNELDIIYSTLEQNRAERLGLEQELVSNKRELARSFLGRLLTGSVRMSPYAGHRLAGYGMPLTARCYAVAAVCAPEFFGDTGGANVARNTMEVFREALQAEMRGASVYETFDRVSELALIGFDEGGAEELEAALRRVIAEIERTVQLQLTVALSCVCTDASQLPDMYRQASVALEFAQMQRGVSFVRYPEQESAPYQFPLELETQLIQTVRDGDAQSACRLLQEYLDGASGSVSVASRQCMRFDLIAMCLRVYANADRILTREAWGGADAAQELMEAGDLETVHALIREQLTRLCQALRDRQRSGRGNLASRVEEYVRAHWQSAELSVASLAESFSMHPSYVSRLFKEEEGIGLLTYINKYRAERAAEMLLGTHLTVAQIAQACGFVSDSALIRIFKQYMGVTPGQYREERQR